MSGFLRKAAFVVGAVALVAATAGMAAPAVAASATGAASAGGIAGISAATLTAIGTYGGLAAGALSAASAATAPGISQQGSQTSFTTNPQSGLPYAMGRTRMSGLRIYANTNTRPGYIKFNDLLWFGAMLSVGGQIHSIEKFTVDNELVTFDGSGEAIGTYQNYMGQKVHMGGTMASALALSLEGGSAPGWTSAHKLSGITHAMWCLRYNKQGEMFGAGAPEPAWIGKWVRVYDPRLDSTYPGGSGPCRALNETTYVWSDNPGLHALTWALGRWQNGKRTCGIGAPVANIRVAEFVECANVCDANGWKVGGVEWTADSKWDTLKRIMQAGGARPTQTGAMIGCLVSTPRTAIATIESRHLLDGLSIAASKSRRDRFNTVIPRYIDEDSDWAVISGTAVTVSAYVTADGGQRTKEIDYPLVQVFSGDDADQPGQLAAYDIVNSREAGPITWTTGPEWIGLKTGDVIYLNVPEEGLVNQPVLITRRSPDPSTSKVSFAAETETYSKHAYALGQSTTPPAPFSLTAPDLKPPAPSATAWAVSGTTSGEGFPALIVSGESEMPSADAIVIDYRKSTDTDWSNSAILSAIEPVTHVIAPLESATDYDVRIAYRIGTIDGNVTIFAGVETGVGKVTIIEGRQDDQDAQIAQLEIDTAAAQIAIAAAEAQIQDIIDNGVEPPDLTELYADVAALEAEQAALLASIDTLDGQVATLTSTTAAQGASITTNATAISTTNANLASLTVTVTSLSGSVTTLQSSYTSLNGTVSTLSSTVTTQGSSITALQTASTTLTGSLATLTTQVLAGNPNIAPNGGFENGLAGWSPGGGGSGWTVASNDYGSYAALTTPFSGTAYIQSTDYIVVRASTDFTFTAESRLLGTGLNPSSSCSLGIIWFNSSDVQVGYVTSTPRVGAQNFTLNGTARSVLTMTAIAPATATKAKLRLIIGLPAAPSTLDAGFRQAKFERGTVATAYSVEASIMQSFTAISTANSAIATLSTTVSTQGATISSQATAITTLQGTSASLQTQINSANASISTNGTAISTLQGSVATLTMQVMAGNRNLVSNGTPENGTAGWSGSQALSVVATSSGRRFLRLTCSSGSNSGYIDFPGIIAAAGAVYTAAGEIQLPAVPGITGSTYCRISILWHDSGGNEIGVRAYGANKIGPSSFSTDGSGRITYAATGIAPSGTASLRLRVEVANATGSAGLYYLDICQMKVENNSSPTAYSNESAVSQSFSTLSTLTTQYASLSSTVSTQGVTISSQQTAITTINGNVTTLFGRAAVLLDVGGRTYGYEVNGTPVAGGFKIHGDYFSVERPGGGPGLRWVAANGGTLWTDDGAGTTCEMGYLA